MPQPSTHYQFVTGKLAEHAVRDIVARVAQVQQFEFTVTVLPITVAALMTPKWLKRHLQIAPQTTAVVLPGYLENKLGEIAPNYACEILSGPKDIRDLPMFFGDKRNLSADYGQHSIEIIAEVNHANRLDQNSLLQQALTLRDQGADIIDLGATPGEFWNESGRAARMLVEAGLRVSIDSFDAAEVAAACDNGAELVLSVNSSNREAAVDWGTEVVLIPDTPNDEKSFEETLTFLDKHDVRFRLDPILEPIGCGFAQSLVRYANCRRAHPNATMMMGIGNVTELTDVDSAGMNVLLLGFCQELAIESVLTTQVINWSRSSVEECRLARQLVHYACKHKVPPKHLTDELVVLRDVRVNAFGNDLFSQLAKSIRDRNFRIFANEGQVHAVSNDLHVAHADPFETMKQLLDSDIGESIDAAHAFYLGFEMSKAHTANILSKQYEQDEPLDWGYLTQAEPKHRRLTSPTPD